MNLIKLMKTVVGTRNGNDVNRDTKKYETFWKKFKKEVDISPTIDYVDENGDTPLMVALSIDLPECVDVLLKSGKTLGLNRINNKNQSAFLLACFNSSINTLLAILSKNEPIYINAQRDAHIIQNTLNRYMKSQIKWLMLKQKHLDEYNSDDETEHEIAQIDREIAEIPVEDYESVIIDLLKQHEGDDDDDDDEDDEDDKIEGDKYGIIWVITKYKEMLHRINTNNVNQVFRNAEKTVRSNGSNYNAATKAFSIKDMQKSITEYLGGTRTKKRKSKKRCNTKKHKHHIH